MPAGRGGGARPTATHCSRLPARARRQAPLRDRSARATIRRLTYADLPQVVAIERRAFPTPWSLAMFVLELSKPAGVCLAARRATRSGRLPDLLALRHGLAPDERVRGPGPPARAGSPRALLSALIERVGDPARSSRSRCGRSNVGAIALYERFGFRSAGVRRRYYQDNGEDALMMWRTPGDAARHARRRTRRGSARGAR